MTPPLSLTPQPASSDSDSLVSSGETERSAWSASSASLTREETATVDSNLFLYLDMHGHASKRGEADAEMKFGLLDLLSFCSLDLGKFE